MYRTSQVLTLPGSNENSRKKSLINFKSFMKFCDLWQGDITKLRWVKIKSVELKALAEDFGDEMLRM
jgi:hypothetical protein